MKKILFNTVKTLLLPVIIYCIFLCVCFDRFSNWNCVYTIFLQSIIPTITAYAVAYGNICGVFDFTVGSALIISGVVGGLCAAKFGFVGMVLGAFAAGLVTTAVTGLLNWVLKIPSLVLTMGLTMIYEIVGKQLAGQFGFVQIDSKLAFLGSRRISSSCSSARCCCSISSLTTPNSASTCARSAATSWSPKTPASRPASSNSSPLFTAAFSSPSPRS